jgi:hypothetical protein
MRACMLSLFLTMAALFPKVANAQFAQFGAPLPEVTAANAEWQVNGEVMLVAGLVYLPTREFRLFDAEVMTQIGVYQGVPVYADVTLEPYGLVYVPVGSFRMRTYERMRDREQAGIPSGRAPLFAVQSPSVMAVENVVNTAGSVTPIRTPEPATSPEPAHPTHIESIPAPHANDGIWLQFNGRRWYSAGAAAPFSPDRFTRVGEYHGFPVYKDPNSSKDEIWVAVVIDGPVAPYERR